MIDLPAWLDEHCPGLIYRRGVTTWKVQANANDKTTSFETYATPEEVPEAIKYIKPSMFPGEENPELTKTVKILPHD